MTKSAKSVLDSFEALPEAEQHEVFARLLRRLTDVEFPLLDDATLMQAADAVFLSYDLREAGV